jgi:4-amino-4-deoxy-L-arabinose transferase-like glycosyltransferase
VNVKIADHIYAGEWPIYFQEAWGHEPLYHYAQAASMALLGHNVLGVRASSAAFGVLGVLATYLAFRRLFGRNVAAVAALFLAASFWSLMYSRVGLRHISLPPWIGVSVYCFWRGLESPAGKKLSGTLWFALGGLSMGTMLYTYFASRAVPAVFAAFVVYLSLFHRPSLRGRWLGVILFFAIAALVVTPISWALYSTGTSGRWRTRPSPHSRCSA